MSVESVAADCETVRVSLDDPVEHAASVTIDRPAKRNALNAQVRDELAGVLDAIDGSAVRVVVLTGAAAGGAFVAGADVSEFQGRGYVEQRRVSERPRVYERVDALPQPVIARVNGYALGGGCELALACDIRVAHETAELGQPEVTLGIMPGGGATQRLPRLVGEGQAMRLILTGEVIGAHEAADIGLVDEVHADDTFDDRVAELAAGVAANSPLVLESAKRAVRAASRMDLDDGIEYEAALFTALFATEDTHEGLDAFLEDRDPAWTGR